MRSTQEGLLPCQARRVSRVGQQTASKLITMADGETPADSPRVDKEMVKEALHEILNELPAFKELSRQKEGEKGKGGSKVAVPGSSSSTSKGEEVEQEARM